MSRNKVLTLIIIVIVALLAAFGIWYYFSLSHGGIGGGANGGLGGVSTFPSSQGGVSSSSPAAIVGSSTSPEAAAAPVPRLRQIANVPVAGSTFFDQAFQTVIISTSSVKGKIVTKTTKVNHFRTFMAYMQRADGHLYETATDTLFTGRFSNITIPKVYEADFLANNGILLRYLNDNNETVESFFAHVFRKPAATTSSSTASSTTSSTTTSQSAPSLADATTSPEIIDSQIDNFTLRGNFLPANMNTFSISQDKTKLFYLSEGTTETVGVILNLATSKSSVIFHNPFKQWLPDWSANSTIFMTTSPSANSSGYLYTLNQSTGVLSKLLGPKTGFQSLGNQTGTKILYSTGDGASASLFIYSLKDKTSTALNIKTLPEKCVWSTLNSDLLYCAVPNTLPQAAYPDAWYQGLVSFSDSLWSINTLTGQTLLLANPTLVAGVAIDGTHLSLNSTEDTLMFTNKADLTLWDLRLKEVLPPVTTASTTSTSTSR